MREEAINDADNSEDSDDVVVELRNEEIQTSYLPIHLQEKDTYIAPVERRIRLFECILDPIHGQTLSLNIFSRYMIQRLRKIKYLIQIPWKLQNICHLNSAAPFKSGALHCEKIWRQCRSNAASMSRIMRRKSERTRHALSSCRHDHTT